MSVPQGPPPNGGRQAFPPGDSGGSWETGPYRSGAGVRPERNTWVPAPAPTGPLPGEGTPPQTSSHPPAARRSGGRGRRLWAWALGPAVTLVGVLAVLFLGFVSPGWFYRDVFDADSVGTGVRQVLRDSYGVEGVESVFCPPSQPVQPGHSFTCRVMVGDENQYVRVVVRDERGTYAVQRPD
ncbi:DUF4333 domain-containing protein [Actinopolyspora mortivallis]|uniref:DUF4333 domain-containing protein n=1 Tax=Actinopolyspora mortivallis TaxID=33906 RepID=UPI0009FFDD52|nr:DUF4333 domain-containing protein [Actinopolyspora mortivallis]